MRYARCDKTHKFNEEYQICKFVETFFVFCAFAYLEFKFTYQDIIRIVKRYKSVQARNNGIKFAKNLIQNIFGLGMPTNPYLRMLLLIPLINDLV